VTSTPFAGAIQDAANILDTVPEAYVCLDSGVPIHALNRASERLLGESRAHLLGKVFWEVYPALVGTTFRGELPPCHGRARSRCVRGP